MTEATKTFLEQHAPFRPMKRFTATLAMSGFVVRSARGEDLALCDDPDVAEAIADTLNSAICGGATAPSALTELRAVHERFAHLDEILRMASDHPDDDPFHRAAKELWIAICNAVAAVPAARDPHFWDKQ